MYPETAILTKEQQRERLWERSEQLIRMINDLKLLYRHQDLGWEFPSETEIDCLLRNLNPHLVEDLSGVQEILEAARAQLEAGALIEASKEIAGIDPEGDKWRRYVMGQLLKTREANKIYHQDSRTDAEIEERLRRNGKESSLSMNGISKEAILDLSQAYQNLLAEKGQTVIHSKSPGYTTLPTLGRYLQNHYSFQMQHLRQSLFMNLEKEMKFSENR